jgi:hypothetical protein
MMFVRVIFAEYVTSKSLNLVKLSLCLLFTLTSVIHAEQRLASLQNSVNSDLSFNDNLVYEPIEINEINLSPTHQAVFSNPLSWSDKIPLLIKVVSNTHKVYSANIGTPPPFKVNIKLTPAKSFYKLYGVPSWTNALFFRSEILIPIADGTPELNSDMLLSLKHEYIHAMIKSISNGECPGWFDEGLAQYSEGELHQSLVETMNEWVKRGVILPFNILSGGFTQLDTEYVPMAYAQSYYATKYLIENKGYSKIRLYLQLLRQKIPAKIALIQAFQITEETLGNQIKKYVFQY